MMGWAKRPDKTALRTFYVCCSSESLSRVMLPGLVGLSRPLETARRPSLLTSSGCLPGGLRSLARPGRPVSPGRLDGSQVKGRHRRSRRDAEFAERP
jgi:hypothetical protein